MQRQDDQQLMLEPTYINKGGQPRKPKDEQIQRFSIGLPPEIKEYLDGVENRSHFIAAALEFYIRMKMEMKYLSFQEFPVDKTDDDI